MIGTSYVHRGTAFGGASRKSNAANCLALSTVAAAIDKIWCLPIMLEAGELDTMGFEVTGAGGAGNKARIFLFSNKADTKLWPGKLLAAGTEEDGTATTVKETTLSNLKVDRGLHWILYANGSGTVCTVRAAAVGAIEPWLGMTSTPAHITAYSRAVTYSSTLTTLFGADLEFATTSPTQETAAMPLVWVKYAK